MLLYTETQLGRAYKAYQRHQIKQDVAFITLKHFRLMFENLMTIAVEGNENEVQHN